MGVVRTQGARRWAIVTVGAVALLAAPQAVAAARPVADSDLSSAALVDRIAHSARVQHSGLVDIQGSLGLPDLPRLGDVGALLGGTTRARVWWAGPKQWRVDTLSATGERDLYRADFGLMQWDFEDHDRDVTIGEAAARLPRTEDLLPPQLGRRILGGLGPDDQVERIGSRRIAGISAAGLRVRPTDSRSTVAAVEVWADPGSGLPLEVRVLDNGHVDPAIRTRFDSVHIGAPDRLVVLPRLPADAPVHQRGVADLADAIDRFGELVLPETLAGETRGVDLIGSGSVETYGQGLTRFSVLALPRQISGRLLEAARTSGGGPLDVAGGDALLLPSRLLNAVIARTTDGDRGYLLVGTVDSDTLRLAVSDLFTDPPPFR